MIPSHKVIGGTFEQMIAEMSEHIYPIDDLPAAVVEFADHIVPQPSRVRVHVYIPDFLPCVEARLQDRMHVLQFKFKLKCSMHNNSGYIRN